MSLGVQVKTQTLVINTSCFGDLYVHFIRTTFFSIQILTFAGDKDYMQILTHLLVKKINHANA